jgi:CRISPR-associated protein Cas1
MRPYYIFKSGRLRRKGNTLYLEKIDEEPAGGEEEPEPLSDSASADQPDELMAAPAGPQPASASAAESDESEAESVDASAMTDTPADELPDDETLTDDESESAATSPASSSDRPRPIPVEDVNELFLFGEISLNTKLLNFLGQKAIPAHTFNYYGFYTGSYYPRETNVSGHLLVKQVENYTDAAKRLPIAKEFLRSAYHNLHRNLLYYRNRGKEVEDAIEAMEKEAVQIEAADSIAALMGAEGRMRETYYRAFNEILKLETPFLKRVKRPPDNLINALISFGNSLLYSATLGQIYRTPLNPTVSFLHEPGTRRFSLALDVAEIFKPIIVDKMIFKLINKQMVTDDDLMPEVGYAHLKERARKAVVQEFEDRLQATVKHRRLGRNVSYRGFIRLECYKLVRHLLGIESYRALRAWW